VTAPGETVPGETAPGVTAPATVPDVTVPGQAPPAETVHAASPQAPAVRTDTPITEVLPGAHPGLESTRLGGTAGAAAAGGATAGATTAASTAGAVQEPEAPPRRAGTPVLAAAAAVLALLVIAAGYLIGSSGGDDSSESSSVPAGSSVATGGSLELSFPNSWRKVAEPPAVPGLELRNPIALTQREGPSGAALGAGMTDATGPALLPASFLSRLDEEPPRDDAVQLGELEAFRYANLKPEGFDKSLTLYVSPTTDGVATVACTAGSGAGEFLPACEDVASGLQLVNGDSFALGPDEDYLNRLNGTMSDLNSARKEGNSSLKKASTPSKQAKAAQTLAKAYGDARSQLSGLTVSPAVADAEAAVRAALLDTETAYRGLASAAKNSKSGAYDKARVNVRKGDAALQRALKDVSAAS
jgi:hypothetical protein